MKIKINGWEYKVKVARHQTTCNTCSQPIEPGDVFIWRYGGHCHLRGCSGVYNPPVTASGTSTQPPPARKEWRYAATYGECLICREAIEPKQPVYPHGSGEVHTRCWA